MICAEQGVLRVSVAHRATRQHVLKSPSSPFRASAPMMTEPTPDAPMNTDSNANTNMETNESPMMNPMEYVNASMESGGGEAMESRNGSGEAMMAGEEMPMDSETGMPMSKEKMAEMKKRGLLGKLKDVFHVKGHKKN